METYATFLVYLWAIYENVLKAITLAMLIGLFYPILAHSFSNLIQQEILPIKYNKHASVIFLIAGFLTVVFPKKEYLPYIIAASPVASAAISSYQDGKLKKIDTLIDLSLDKAISSITNPNSKENK